MGEGSSVGSGAVAEHHGGFPLVQPNTSHLPVYVFYRRSEGYRPGSLGTGEGNPSSASSGSSGPCSCLPCSCPPAPCPAQGWSPLRPHGLNESAAMPSQRQEAPQPVGSWLARGLSTYRIILQRRTTEQLLPSGKAGPLCLPPPGLSQAPRVSSRKGWGWAVPPWSAEGKADKQRQATSDSGRATPKCKREELPLFPQNPSAMGREKG